MTVEQWQRHQAMSKARATTKVAMGAAPWLPPAHQTFGKATSELGSWQTELRLTN